MNTIQSRSMTVPNANLASLADALADNIARSLHEGWKLRWEQTQTGESQRLGEQLHDFFEYTQDQWPHNVVLTADGEEVSYAEIDERSTELANFLRLHGVSSETVVGICLPQSIDAYITLLAVVKTGGRYLQLDSELPCEQIRHKANETNLIAVITTSELGLQEDDVGTSLIFLECWREADAESFTDPLAHGKRVPGGDVCYIIYTTSEDERPKGVAIEPRRKLQKLRSLVSQQNGFGFQALTLFGHRIEGFLGAV